MDNQTSPRENPRTRRKDVARNVSTIAAAVAKPRIATLLAYIIYMCAFTPITAQTQDDFAQTYTWRNDTPPTLQQPGTGTGAEGNRNYLVTLSGVPSGTLWVPETCKVTIRGTVTDTNASLSINTGYLVEIKWEAELSGNLNSTSRNGLVQLSTQAVSEPPPFELTGSISNSGRTPALYSVGVPVIVSGNGVVQNTKNRLANEILFEDCAAIYAIAPVTVKDNARVMATGGGRAIIAGLFEHNTGDVTVSGGLVFGTGEVILGAEKANENKNVILLITPAVLIGPTGTGTVIGWNKDAGRTTYQTNSTTDILKLPAGTTAKWTTQGGQTGIAWQNSTSGFIPISGVSLDDTPPTVASVLPSGADIQQSGNVVVTFNEAMDASVAGTVTLNGGGGSSVLTSGNWSNGDKTCTLSYSGLEEKTTYTVKVSGFADKAGNVMDAVTGGYTFETTDKKTFVTNTNNNGPGSLREAIKTANDGDVIDCSLIAGQTITLETYYNNASEDHKAIRIKKNVTIEGYGITITQTANFGMPLVKIGDQGTYDPHPNVTINRVHFKNGNYSDGSAILSYATALTINSCIFSENKTEPAVKVRRGTTNINGCTFYGNTNEGAFLVSSGSVTLTGNVFYGNTGGSDANASSTSGGYNVTDNDMDQSTGGINFNATGDTKITTQSFNTGTFRPTSAALNIVASGISGFPNKDFYGAVRTFPSGTAGAVQYSATPVAPVLSNGTVSRTNDTEATIDFSTNQAGMAYYLVVDADDDPPLNTAVKAGGASFGFVSGYVSGKAVLLTVGAKDIYVVVESAAGDLNTPYKIAAEAAVAPFAEGTGTAGDPVLIRTVEELDMIRDYASRHYKLMNDIDLTAYLSNGGAGYDKWGAEGWQPIGKEGASDNWNRNAFKGTFDGNGYKISGLFINNTDTGKEFASLFGKVAGATIKNLGVTGVNITSSSLHTGAIAGKLEYGVVIENCYSTGTVSSTIGIQKPANVGGIVGTANSSSIENCYSLCTVTSGGNAVGGIAGKLEDNSSVINCYATGNVSGYAAIGGLVGQSDNSTVKNSVAANSAITASFGSGSSFNRITGTGSNPVYQNNYANRDMLVNSATRTDDASPLTTANGEGKTLAVLKTATFYTTQGNWDSAAWDFTDVWTIDEGVSLPVFKVKAAPTYTVSIVALENGTVELDKTPANYAAGETVILTVTPDENYELQTILAYKTSDAETTVETRYIASLPYGTAIYEFTMPDFGVTVAATFEQLTSTNIDNITGTKTIVSESYYDLTGKPASATAKGFVIKRTVYSDGSVINSKAIIK